ncbi:Cofilin [Dactylellina cionopaga]|nr:Cofilin [Dactylellina cionopaga]
MSTSGPSVDSECIRIYHELRLSQKYKYLFFKLSKNRKEIQFEKSGDPEKKFDDFLAELPSNEFRWCVYNIPPKGIVSVTGHMPIFISWCPDETNVMSKMAYSRSKEALRRSFPGIHFEIEVNDKEDILNIIFQNLKQVDDKSYIF